MAAPGEQPGSARGLLAAGLVYALASTAPAVTSVAVLPLVTRLLSVEEYATVAVATVIVQVGMIICAFGMGAAITRQYILAAEGAIGARGLVLTSAVLSSALGGVLVASAPLWSPLVLGRPGDIAVRLAVATAAAAAWCTIAQAFFRGADKAGAFVLVAVGAYLGGPGMGLVFILIDERNAERFLLGMFLGHLLTGAISISVIWRSGLSSFSVAALVRALRIGLPTLPHQVSLYLVVAGLIVIADRLLSDGGRANITLTLGSATTVIIAAVNNAWAPAVYRTPLAERGAMLRRTSGQMAWAAAILGGLVAALSPLALLVLAPSSYRPLGLVGPVAVASLAGLFSVVYLASGHLIFARGRTALLSVSTPLAVAVGLACSALLVSRFGIFGVALGYVITYLALALATTAVQRGVSGERWRPPLMLPQAFLSIAAATAGALLPGTGVPALAARGVLTACLIAAGVAALRVESHRVRRR